MRGQITISTLTGTNGFATTNFSCVNYFDAPAVVTGETKIPIRISYGGIRINNGGLIIK